MINECGSCGRYFWSSDGFYRCWICFKTDRKWDLNKGDKALDGTLKEFDKLYRENIVLKKQPPKQVTKKILKLDTIARKRVRKLLKLCHPDRHISSLAIPAQEITTWLLEIRVKRNSDKKRP